MVNREWSKVNSEWSIVKLSPSSTDQPPTGNNQPLIATDQPSQLTINHFLKLQIPGFKFAFRYFAKYAVQNRIKGVGIIIETAMGFGAADGRASFIG